MVYIKLTPEIWTVSGMVSVCPENKITMIDKIRYIPYQTFKQAAAKIDGEVHGLLKRDNVISNLQMKKLIKQSEQTPQQKKISQQIRNRHQLRMSQRSKQKSSSNYYFEQKRDESIKDLSKSISFGLTFIFSFFMAGLTGYYFGTYFLSLSMNQSLILAAFFIIFTIVIETSLYIIKQNRQDANTLKKRKKMDTYKYSQPKPLRLNPKDIAQALKHKKQ